MYFRIRTASGGYRAYAYGGNHEIVWVSEVYVSRTGARHAVQLMRDGAATAPLYED